MIIQPGEKLHVIIRRNFDTDLRRHFAGEVVDVAENIVRAEGYAFVLDTATNQYIRRTDIRTRVISLTDAGNLIHILPIETMIDKFKYVISKEGRLIVTDGKTMCLDINEFNSSI